MQRTQFTLTIATIVVNSRDGHMRKAISREEIPISPLLWVIKTYGLHHICLALNNCEPTATISVIQSTDEKIISMTFGVLIDTFVTEKRKTVNLYENL